MIKFSDIDTSTVKSSDIGRAHKAFQGSTAFYLVENSRNLLNEDGSLVEYKVTYSKEKGFQCQCHAGLEGFIHCKKGVCQHVILAVACEREVRAALAIIEATPANDNSNIFEKINAKDGKLTAALAEIAEEEAATIPTLIVDGQAADVETLNRVFIDARPARTSRAKAQSPKAFSILK